MLKTRTITEGIPNESRWGVSNLRTNKHKNRFAAKGQWLKCGFMPLFALLTLQFSMPKIPTLEKSACFGPPKRSHC